MLRHVAHLWLNRKNYDTPGRREALAAVDRYQPAAVIIGGSRGIGLALAKTFLANGHYILIVARNPAALENAMQALNPAHDGRCRSLALDVSRPDAADAIEAGLREHGLYLDILVNSAAQGLSGPFEKHASSELSHLTELNVTALTQLLHHALPAMLARGRGGIINFASLGGYVPGPNQAAYYASKSYVLSLSEAIASEISGRGVRVCAIAPGPVATDFHANMRADRALYRRILPELSADDVARAAYRGFTIGQRVVVPGLLYRLAFLSLRVLPHPITVPIAETLLKNPER